MKKLISEVAISKLSKMAMMASKAMYRVLGDGNMAQFYRKMGVCIGENTVVYSNVVIGRNGKDPVVIGKNCVLTGCAIIGHDASLNSDLSIDRSPKGAITIGDNCFIGYGSIILMGVSIGNGVIVGAGSVVTKDIPDEVVVAGNPAVIISKRSELLNKRKAWINKKDDS